MAEPIYLSGCSGKCPYFTRNEAKLAKRKFNSVGGHIKEIYQCKYSTFNKTHFHLTSMTKHQYKAVKQRVRDFSY